MRYLPHTAAEISEMLSVIGKASIDELFATIPESARFEGQLAVAGSLAEPELMRHLSSLAARNTGAQMLSFLGAGMYDHHIPPAVDQLLLRSEFYTAYTPYQPEVAQGTLQAIWEFQTIVSEIYGLPLANASMYDGASAAAEAAQMARRLTKRDGLVLSGCLNPDYRDVIITYVGAAASTTIKSVAAAAGGETDVAALIASITDETAAVIVGYPSFLGRIVDLRPVADACHARGALLVATNTEPYALAVAEAPGALGADIVAGEGQALACPPQFGGPGVGLFACRDERPYLQQLPGRVCGETVDKNGERGFVLTLATREQHIRRERATSNICTNQGLLALSMTIRASLLGKRGFQQVGARCAAKAHYLYDRLLSLPGIEEFGGAPFVNEFALRTSRPARELCSALEQEQILAGLDLGRIDAAWRDRLLVAVTEKHTRADLDRFVAALEQHL